MASRIAARSTIAGTPVKSWSRTRDGMNGTSASVVGAGPPRREGLHVRRARSSPPPALRSAFSSRILTRDRAPCRGRSDRPGRRAASSPAGPHRGRRGRRKDQDVARWRTSALGRLDAWKGTPSARSTGLARRRRRGAPRDPGGAAGEPPARRDARRSSATAGHRSRPGPRSPRQHACPRRGRARARPSAPPRRAGRAAARRDHRRGGGRDGARRRAASRRLAGRRRRVARRGAPRAVPLARARGAGLRRGAGDPRRGRS